MILLLLKLKDEWEFGTFQSFIKFERKDIRIIV